MKTCIAGLRVPSCGIVAFAALLLISQTVRGEIISSERRLTWQGNVGILGGIPDSSKMPVFTTVSPGASVATVLAAISACPSNQVVQLSAGDYTFTADLIIGKDGVVLRGAGMNATRIVFNGPTLERVRLRKAISEAALSVDANLSEDAVKGDTVLKVAAVPAWVTAGELIGIDQINDPAFVSDAGTSGGQSYRGLTGNGARGLAQLNRVISKTTSSITVELPLFYGYKIEQAAQIFQPLYNPSSSKSLKKVGIENMTFTYNGSGSDGHGASLECADQCWFKDVAITNTYGGAAVWPVFSYRCEFRGMTVHHSHLYGGGQAYGIAPWHVSTACLIEDNIFYGLHNAMTVDGGASGNVFAYNYEFDGRSDAGQNPGMNTHLVHTYMNLFEGNYCEDKMLADWTHGSSSHNTVFRCRITGENGTGDGRACISIEYYNRYWNVVGNVLGVPGLQNKYISNSSSAADGSQGTVMKLGGEVNINGDYSPSDADSYTSGMFILKHGNWNSVQNLINWESSISDHTIPNSLYLAAKPAWFGDRPWPPFDPARVSSAAVTNIPAGYRYVFGVNPPTEGRLSAPENLRVTP